MGATVIPLSDLRRSETALLFQGKDLIDTSVFVTEYPNGRGPDLHFHPYPELFLVEEGTATFSVDGEDVVVEAGHFVVVPAEAHHGFKNRHDEKLRVVSVHPSPKVIQTDL